MKFPVTTRTTFANVELTIVAQFSIVRTLCITVKVTQSSLVLLIKNSRFQFLVLGHFQNTSYRGSGKVVSNTNNRQHQQQATDLIPSAAGSN